MIVLDVASYGYSNNNIVLFGIHLKSAKEEIKKIFRLKSGILNVADLHSFEYVLKSIKYPNESTVKYHVNNLYLKTILKKLDNKYTLIPHRNEQLIANVRKLAENTPFLEVICDKKGFSATIASEVKTEAKRIENELARNKGTSNK
jgi:hypothetical protein